MIGGELGFRILTALCADGETGYMSGGAYAERSKLETLLGPGIWDRISGRTIIDFGSGEGTEAIEMASHGTRRVIGVEVHPVLLETARARGARAGFGEDRCVFTTTPPEPADVIVCLDSFEHFDDPAGVLTAMGGMLKASGEVLVSFGPTWFHPLGGHLFSVFPWAHLVFTEEALCRWRRAFKTTGLSRNAHTFGECGLNQMTIRRFERLVEQSPFRFVELETVPIRRLKWLASNLTREFTTAVVRCRLAVR
jgi:SAM-dependent methyltransferase